jgi:hypothetical protein
VISELTRLMVITELTPTGTCSALASGFVAGTRRFGDR